MDYEKLFKSIGDNKTLKIAKETSLIQQKEGVDENVINQEIIEFLTNQLKWKESLRKSKIIDNLYKGIRELIALNDWVSLHSLSKNAIEASLTCIEKDENFKNYEGGLKLRSFILNAGLNEMKGVFNEAWLKENYKEVYKIIKK